MSRYTELEEKQMKVIEQLEREREWLIYKMIDAYKRKYKGFTMEDMKEMLADDMQQALKEG